MIQSNKTKMKHNRYKNVAVIVAHPDDETLWSGGILLSNPQWKLFILSLCRGSDTDRAPKFTQALKEFGAWGIMGDLDDSPLQQSIHPEEVEKVIIDLLPVRKYDLIITHHPNGEYTRHLRHEEIGTAVINSWQNGNLSARELWCFAYEDGGGKYYPKAVESADIVNHLDNSVWERKYQLITTTYGFDENSWEAHTTPTTESFCKFTNQQLAAKWLNSLPKP